LDRKDQDIASEFDLILDNCLDRLNNGHTLDSCLGNYPEFVEELEPLLTTASEFQARSLFMPSEAARRKGRVRLQQTIKEIEWKHNKPKETLLQWFLGQPKLWIPVTVTILLLFLSFGLAKAFLGATNDGPATTVIASGTSSENYTPPPIVTDTGVLEIRVTDAPAYDISAVHVTISNIEVHRVDQSNATNNQESAEGTGWETAIEESKTFELLELRGINAVLYSIEFEAGRYDQIRMNIEEVMVTFDGKTISARLSGDQLEVTGSFEIEDSTRTVVTMDFDAAESVIITSEGKVIFEPVVTVDVVYEPDSGLVDESGNDQSLPSSRSRLYVPPEPQPGFSIFVNRVEINGDGTFTAHFGYLNSQDTNMALNRSELCPADGSVIGNPPSILLAGRHDKAFAAIAPVGTNIVWTASSKNTTKSSTALSTYAN
jgi:hypothetical protein